MEHCKAIHQWEREGRWPAVFGKYLTALRTAHPEGGVAATREYVKILALYAEPTGGALPEVLERALELRCFSLEAVKLLLHQHQHPVTTPVPLAFSAQSPLAPLATITSPEPNLGVYDQLLGRHELAAAGSHSGREDDRLRGTKESRPCRRHSWAPTSSN